MMMMTTTMTMFVGKLAASTHLHYKDNLIIWIRLPWNTWYVCLRVLSNCNLRRRRHRRSPNLSALPQKRRCQSWKFLLHLLIQNPLPLPLLLLLHLLSRNNVQGLAFIHQAVLQYQRSPLRRLHYHLPPQLLTLPLHHRHHHQRMVPSKCLLLHYHRQNHHLLQVLLLQLL